MWVRIGLLLSLLPADASADSVVALRTLPAQSIVEAADLTLDDSDIAGALTDINSAIGLEVRSTIYAGRPVTPDNIGPPTLVERNQIVALVFQSGGLSIVAEGRALERGADGDVIRAMNLASRSTLTGRVTATGQVLVGESP